MGLLEWRPGSSVVGIVASRRQGWGEACKVGGRAGRGGRGSRGGL